MVMHPRMLSTGRGRTGPLRAVPTPPIRMRALLHPHRSALLSVRIGKNRREFRSISLYSADDAPRLCRWYQRLGLDFPGPTLLDGQGTGRVYVDDQASPEQVAAIETVLQARNGGPMTILASLIATWPPTTD